MNGSELKEHEFFAAIKEKREPNASLAIRPGDADVPRLGDQKRDDLAPELRAFGDGTRAGLNGIMATSVRRRR